MINPLVQFAECPNSGKTQGTVGQLALPKTTAAGATLIAIATYSYDDPTNAATIKAGSVELTSVARCSDTTGNGDQTFEMFAVANAPSIPAGTPVTMTVQGTDYRGFVFGELPPNYKLADQKMAWQQGITGAKLLTTANTNPGNGEICAITFSAMQTENGVAPYLPTIDGGQALISNWFAYDQKAGAPLALWCYEVQGSNPTYHPEYLSPVGSANDNFITGILIFDVGSSAPVTPPPPATTNKVNLTAGQVASLNGGTSVTITAPAAGSLILAPPTAVVTPPAPPAPPAPSVPPVSSMAGQIKIPVFVQGKFHWAGSWESPAANYSETADSTGVDGESACIEMAAGQPWGFWLPYPPVTAGSPAGNGIGCNLAGMTHITVAVKGVGQLTSGFYKANGTADDISFGNSVTITQANYLVGNANGYNVYAVPLADFGIGTPGWIYKFIMQNQANPTGKWYLDQVGFF